MFAFPPFLLRLFSPFSQPYFPPSVSLPQLEEKLNKRREIDEPLPEGWELKIDKDRNRPYYVNRKSKEKTWKRPKPLPKEMDLDGDGVLDSDQNADGTLTEEAKARYKAKGSTFEEN